MQSEAPHDLHRLGRPSQPQTQGFVTRGRTTAAGRNTAAAFDEFSA